MELYHALPFFFYLLGVCHQQRLPSQKISKLLTAVPVCLLTYSTELDPIISKTIVPWFLSITSFSMLPLLSYEGLLIPTVALTVLYLALVHDYDHLVTLGQDRSVSLRTMSPAPPAPLPPVSTLN